jgi:hypothetical protein
MGVGVEPALGPGEARNRRQGPAVVSAISALEITKAVRRGRLALESPPDEWFADLQASPELRFEPVSVEIARLAGGFAHTAPGDPADRIIVVRLPVRLHSTFLQPRWCHSRLGNVSTTEYDSRLAN